MGKEHRLKVGWGWKGLAGGEHSYWGERVWLAVKAVVSGHKGHGWWAGVWLAGKGMTQVRKYLLLKQKLLGIWQSALLHFPEQTSWLAKYLCFMLSARGLEGTSEAQKLLLKLCALFPETQGDTWVIEKKGNGWWHWGNYCWVLHLWWHGFYRSELLFWKGKSESYFILKPPKPEA